MGIDRLYAVTLGLRYQLGIGILSDTIKLFVVSTSEAAAMEKADARLPDGMCVASRSCSLVAIADREEAAIKNQAVLIP